jgi:arginine decarboxylase
LTKEWCHKDKLSFEVALRNAGIENATCKCLEHSPPQSHDIKEEGLKLLSPGQVTFCVMAKRTNEPNRLVSAAIGVAMPKDGVNYGYLSEHHAFGETSKISGDYAEDLAATMLATTLGIPFDPNEAWNARKKDYRASGHIFKTTHICQSAEGDKNGLWTTVVAAAVFIIDFHA